RQVDQRTRATRQLASLLEADRRTDVALATEGGSRRAQRAGDDQDVARPGAGPSRYTLRDPECGDAQDEAVGRTRVAADHGRACLREALIQLHYVGDSDVGWGGQRDDEPFRLGSGR